MDDVPHFLGLKLWYRREFIFLTIAGTSVMLSAA